MQNKKCKSQNSTRQFSIFNFQFSICILPCLAILAAGCEPNSSTGKSSVTNPKTSPGAQRVATVVVELQDLVRRIERTATVEAFETADLYAKVGGYLDKIHVDIGDSIKQDQPLAELYVPEMLKSLQQKQALFDQAEANVDQARAAIRQAESQQRSAEAAREAVESERGEKQAHFRARQADLKRIKYLVEQESLRKELLDAAREEHGSAESALATLEARIRTATAEINAAKANVHKEDANLRSAQKSVVVAQANYDYDETMLQYATIKAPFDGLVTKRWVHTGAFIQSAEENSAAKPLLRVVRVDKIRITLDIPMKDVKYLDKVDTQKNLPGDRAVLDRIDVLPGESFEGRVTRFARALDIGSRMMRVEIELKNELDNPDRLLLPGYYGFVTLYLDESPQTPVVPSSALLTDEERKYVFVVRDGRAHKQFVTTNYEDGKIVGIATGLKGGEHVVRAGGGQLSDGQQVTATVSK